MNTNEFDIITDFRANADIPCEDGVIAISKDITCAQCDSASEFSPMIASDGSWLCKDCWTDGEDRMFSENMIDRLAEASNSTRINYHIRNM